MVIVLIWIFLMGIVLPVHSQSTYGGEIYRVFQSATGIALGNGPVSTNGEIFAALVNPSLMSAERKTEIGVIHSRQFMSGISYNFLGMAANQGKNRIAVAFMRLGVDNILDSRQAQIIEGNDWGIDFSRVTSFQVADYLGLVAFSPATTWKGIRTGFALRILYRDYQVEKAWGNALDLGVSGEIAGGLTFGVRLANFLGSGIHWTTGKNEWNYPEFSYGFRYRHMVKNFHFIVFGNFFHYFDHRAYSSLIHLGAVSLDFSSALEIGWDEKIVLRAGREETGNLVLGAGIRIPKMEIQYGYRGHSELGNVHNISVIFMLPYSF